jgi:hypothetical protein
MSKAQKGVIRPLWIGTAVVTCVVFGSTINKCLTCFPQKTIETAAEAALVRGERLDAPRSPPSKRRRPRPTPAPRACWCTST